MVQANRALVDTQEQLSQISQILGSGDPNLVNSFISEYQKIMAEQNGQQQRSPLYLPGPGQSPGFYQPRSDNDAEYWYGRLREIHDRGLPPTEKARQQAMQDWAEFPEAAMMHLVSILPEM